MPKINVYLSDELAAAVKEAGIPVSPVCQHALEAAVRKVAAAREMAEKVDFLNDDNPMGRLTNLTDKAHRAIGEGVRLAREHGQERVGTEYLLAGVLGIGDNMALNVLRSMDIQPDDIREDLTARLSPGPALDPEESSLKHLSPESAAVLKRALNDAIGLGHNYIGCEHLLLALVADTDGLGGEVLRSHGAEPRLVRRATQAALSGFSYARSQGPVTQQASGAERLRETLVSFGERLDRIEARLGSLPEGN
ncbi:MAG TPA: Clp protease N-terminal domain-containing protein [Pseudonocardiaceae bacterium]|nr:Clp protease N-terminal domain-containing protein [Pseudonocardiaceae bacterium]